jgi:soluble lytic murein transglycosylase
LIVGTSSTFIRPACATPARRRHVLCCLFAATAAVFFFCDATDARPARGSAHGTHAAAAPAKHGAEHAKRGAAANRAKRDRPSAAASAVPLPPSRPALADLPPDLAAVRQAFDLVRKGKIQDAIALEASIADPVAKRLVEWMLLRRGDSNVAFDRYVAFINDNPAWPSIPLLRRRAEARLWQQRRDAATVRGFVGTEPAGVYGDLALARVLLAAGDRASAERSVRNAWAAGELSAETEAAALAAFPDVLTRADHTARMDRRIGAKDFGGAMRAAHRLGDAEAAIVKACVAAEADGKKAKALLDAVPSEARDDAGYALCRIHWLLHQNDVAGAAKAVLAAAGTAVERLETDEWWRERRVLARKLLDQGEARTAYQVVAEAAAPANPYYRAEWRFMAGWIALRFLADAATARAHFAHIDDGSADPIVQARAGYWRGRAAEAAGDLAEMRAQYESAARHATAYYGQLARARLGLGAIALRPPPIEPAQGVANDLLHAAEILYRIGERDLVPPFTSDLAQHGCEAATLALLAELTVRHDDANATLMIGKTALARGLALDHYAFPAIGIPRYAPIAPDIDRSVVFSVARTESAFDQRDKSPANAVGLMQVTPEAGRDTAKRFGVAYDWKKLVSDPVYNTQMGAAELSALLKEYRGSFVMTFAGYNAGRGRVKEWVARYGDPRDPKVDAVDWVERIPFSETRNYVQRVIENLAVYRARFGEGETVSLEPNLLRATIESRAQ